MKYLGSLARWICLIILGLTLLALCFYKVARASTGDIRKPDLDPNFFVNNHVYTLGYVMSVGTVEPGKARIWTLVEFKPSYTPLLYPNDSLLFCGQDAARKFVGLTNNTEVVIVYSRAVSVVKVPSPPPSVIACHNLEMIRKVQP